MSRKNALYVHIYLYIYIYIYISQSLFVCVFVPYRLENGWELDAEILHRSRLFPNLRGLQCNGTKLQNCTKIYNINLYMLLNPSGFFKIYVFVLFLKNHFFAKKKKHFFQKKIFFEFFDQFQPKKVSCKFFVQCNLFELEMTENREKNFLK